MKINLITFFTILSFSALNQSQFGLRLSTGISLYKAPVSTYGYMYDTKNTIVKHYHGPSNQFGAYFSKKIGTRSSLILEFLAHHTCTRSTEKGTISHFWDMPAPGKQTTSVIFTEQKNNFVFLSLPIMYGH